MRSIRSGVMPLVLLFLGLPPLGTAPLRAADLRDHLLVVFNKDQAASAELAQFYAKARGIPDDHVLGISTPVSETITRAEFNNTLRGPVSRYLEEHQWLVRQPRNLRINGANFPTRQALGNQIWSIVLMRGIPLRIENDPTLAAPESVNEPLRPNAAAVDSELSLLTLESYPLAGPIPNPYYHASRVREFDQFLADSIIMVTRLDGPTPEDVRRMIRDSIETEKMELSGRAYFDARGFRDPANPYTTGDEWIRQARVACRAAGFNAALDDAAPVYDDKQPWEDVALYAGWYENHVQGPFTTPGFRFAPGAVAYHIHSFSAESIRSGDRFWVGPFIRLGAAATMGNVYEPFLKMTPNVGVFFQALLEGMTFAEAAYQSQVCLSWMTTFVGDPLYRPFPRPFLENLRIAESRQDRPSDWVLARTLRLLALQERDPVEKITTLLRAAGSRPTPVIWEECGDIVQDLGAGTDIVAACYDKARALELSGISRIRLGLKTAALHQKENRTTEAMQVYEKLLADDPVLAARYDVPQTAIRYATSVGWTQFSPALRLHLAPVSTPPQPSAPPTPAPAVKPPPANKPVTTPAPEPARLNPSIPATIPPSNSPTTTFKPSIP